MFVSIKPLDIDECKNTSACHESALCSNALGSYTCFCKEGFVEETYPNLLICKGWILIIIKIITKFNVSFVAKSITWLQ